MSRRALLGWEERWQEFKVARGAKASTSLLSSTSTGSTSLLSSSLLSSTSTGLPSTACPIPRSRPRAAASLPPCPLRAAPLYPTPCGSQVFNELSPEVRVGALVVRAECIVMAGSGGAGPREEGREDDEYKSGLTDTVAPPTAMTGCDGGALNAGTECASTNVPCLKLLTPGASERRVALGNEECDGAREAPDEKSIGSCAAACSPGSSGEFAPVPRLWDCVPVCIAGYNCFGAALSGFSRGDVGS
jgi:hypothetical protein